MSPNKYTNNAYTNDENKAKHKTYKMINIQNEKNSKI